MLPFLSYTQISYLYPCSFAYDCFNNIISDFTETVYSDFTSIHKFLLIIKISTKCLLFLHRDMLVQIEQKC